MEGDSPPADIVATAAPLTPSELGGVGGLESPRHGATTSIQRLHASTGSLADRFAALTESTGTTGRGRWRSPGWRLLPCG